MTGVYETPARMVRTGQVIKTAVDGHRSSLEVAVVHHETHRSPDGPMPAIRFSGWCDGEWVARGWGRMPDTLVMVVEDRRLAGTYLEVSAGIATEAIA